MNQSYTLKKLPAWGFEILEKEVDFEWPTREMLAQMDLAKARLAEITFCKLNQSSYASVQCKLSDGTISQQFKNSVSLTLEDD